MPSDAERRLHAEHDACGTWAVVSRREFLLESSVFLTSASAALGVRPPQTIALTVGFTTALRIDGDEATYPIPSEDGALIDRVHDVILARYQKAVYALVVWCPHQHSALRWDGDGHRFECPKHHSKFTPDGMFIEGRATRALDRYALRRDGDTVVVALGTVYKQDEDGLKWAAAVVTL